MSSGNWLDRLIQRFQHRWETDRQWRAAMGGVLALVVLLGLCGAAFGISNAAERVLVVLGVGTSGPNAKDAGSVDTGARQVNGVFTFPTAVVTWAVGTAPAVSPIPNSKTPVPNPTVEITPTPTPQPSPSPQPTSGGGTVQCSGGNSGITYSFSPCPQVPGPGSITVNAGSQYARQTARILLALNQSGSCTNNDCGWDWTNLTLDGTGSITVPYTIPQDAVNSLPIGGSININGAPSVAISASPVQQ